VAAIGRLRAGPAMDPTVVCHTLGHVMMALAVPAMPIMVVIVPAKLTGGTNRAAA